ncbi:MAG: hypothetical protein WCI20_03535 [bacterium]
MISTDPLSSLPAGLRVAPGTNASMRTAAVASVARFAEPSVAGQMLEFMAQAKPVERGRR